MGSPSSFVVKAWLVAEVPDRDDVVLGVAFGDVFDEVQIENAQVVPAVSFHDAVGIGGGEAAVVGDVGDAIEEHGDDLQPKRAVDFDLTLEVGQEQRAVIPPGIQREPRCGWC